MLSPVNVNPSAAIAWSSDPYANWTAKKKIGRRKVTRSLKPKEVKDLEAGWHFARLIGMPINRFVTFRPRDINDQNPDQRIATWSKWRNKLAQFARDHNFEFTCVWTRESERDTGRNEHLHVLIHVPSKLLAKFKKRVEGWCDGTDEIDVRACTYHTTTTSTGKQKNVFTYVSKNSPQAARIWNRYYQKRRSDPRKALRAVSQLVGPCSVPGRSSRSAPA